MSNCNECEQDPYFFDMTFPAKIRRQSADEVKSLTTTTLFSKTHWRLVKFHESQTLGIKSYTHSTYVRSSCAISRRKSVTQVFDFAYLIFCRYTKQIPHANSLIPSPMSTFALLVWILESSLIECPAVWADLTKLIIETLVRAASVGSRQRVASVQRQGHWRQNEHPIGPEGLLLRAAVKL